MTKILLKVEEYLCRKSIFAPYPLCLYALKLQIRLHKMFPKTFAHIRTN